MITKYTRATEKYVELNLCLDEVERRTGTYPVEIGAQIVSLIATMSSEEIDDAEELLSNTKASLAGGSL